jgi:predicted AAA+ superfamily ATPase
MAKIIRRQTYLQKLIDRRDNGEVKIITGTRRCGKSWLLKKIYRDYLLGVGVPDDHRFL